MIYGNVSDISNSDTRVALNNIYLSHFRDRCGLPNYRFP